MSDDNNDKSDNKELPAWKIANPPAQSKGRPPGSKSLYPKTPVRFTPRLKRKYLQYVAQGFDRTAAAAKCGISRHTVYSHLKSDPKFADALAIATEKANANLEETLYKRITDGTKTVETDGKGNVLKITTKQNDALLLRALEAKKPSVWGKKSSNTNVNVNVDSTGNSAVSRLAQMLGVEVPDKGEEIDVTDYEEKE